MMKKIVQQATLLATLVSGKYNLARSQVFIEQTGTENPFDGIIVDFDSYSKPTFVDIDNDGDMDLVSGMGKGEFQVYTNNGDGTFSKVTDANNPLANFDVGSRSAPTFVDIDNDGDMDLVSGNYGGTFNVFTNNGGVFTEADPNPLADFVVGISSTPTFVDIEGDGDMDLVSGEIYGAFYVFTNDGGTFTKATTNPLSNFDVGKYSTPTFVDIDGDGDMDLVSGNQSGTFKVYTNNGGVFTEASPNPLSDLDVTINSAPAFVDIDKDGDMDLVSGDRYGKFHFLENTPLVLSIKLSSFELEVADNGILLTWQPTSEVDASGFVIERSSNGSNWQEMGFVESTGSSRGADYSFTDSKPVEGENYYRLKLVDLSGEYEYSDIRVEQWSKSEVAVSIYPNPTSDVLHFIGLSDSNTISIYNNNGALVIRQEQVGNESTVNIASQPSGLYYIELIDEHGDKSIHSIVLE